MKSKHVMQVCDKIYIAGHNGLVGSAIVRKLEKEGFHNIITRSHSQLDLTDSAAVEEFYEKEKPDYLWLPLKWVEFRQIVKPSISLCI